MGGSIRKVTPPAYGGGTGRWDEDRVAATGWAEAMGCESGPRQREWKRKGKEMW